MKNYIYLLFVIVLSCKVAQKTETEIELTDFKIIEAPEFQFLDLGQSIDLGGVTLTKLQGSKAAITYPEKRTQTESKGKTSRNVDKSKSTVNINSGNKDKSRAFENSNNKIKDKSKGDIDKSKSKVKVPGTPFLRILFVFVLLAIGAIWFFYPRIKKLKPPFL